MKYLELHWEEGEDRRGFPVWLRYIDCGHWGLILDDQRVRFTFPPGCALRERVINLDAVT